MTRAQPGRHRAPRPARRFSMITLLLTLVVVIVVAGGTAWWLAQPGESSPPPTVSGQGNPTVTGTQAATLTASRVVERKGRWVTVEDTISADEGDVTIAPTAERPDWGLRQESVNVASPDGTRQAFTKPAMLVAGGSITIKGRYQLTNCPDVLPTRWPSPSKVLPGDWSRTVVRSESPQRTARSLCPKAKATAKRLPGLAGNLRPGHGPVVRLRWRGSSPLTVHAVGSVSGVATVATVAKGPKCVGRCLSRLRPGDAVSLRLRGLEPCPVGAGSNRMTLVTTAKGANTRVVATSTPNLAKRFCGNISDT